ncbi:hypothetical protein GGI07_005377 [Coemansia sp. Benny D115]|nr:hypothetical protein GGI07_005377 [Coemansia sp. Benny D115]
MNMLAIIEAKKYISDQSTAYEQLLLYTHNLYVCQFDCQFTWGFTVCNSIVRVCIIANDKVYLSDDIDLRKSEDRRELVMLLCNMSFCEVDQLGYDLSISYNKDKNRWETTVFDDDEIADGKPGRHVYKIDKQLSVADHLFGCHTRCFKCYKIQMPPDESDDSSTTYDEDSISEELVIIKDAWAFVPKTPEGITYDDPRNEVMIMRKITNALSDNQNFAGMYPILEHGSVVRFVDTDGKYTIKDNKEHVIGRLGENAISENHIRVHKNLAMKPIGELLYSARSVYELIIVVADAMLVYMVIWKKAKILHRDISDNNILITRIDSWVRAMLIDFDNSLDISDPEVLKRVIRPGMTGTLPFMSILNLKNHQGGYYTVLDDWESTLYMLCWLATFGVNAEGQKKDNLRRKLLEPKGCPQNDKLPVGAAPSTTNTLPAINDPPAINTPPAINDPPASNDPIINCASDKNQVDIIVKDLVEIMEKEGDDAFARMNNALLAA